LEKRNLGIRENIRYINQINKQGSHMLAASFGMHASLTLSEETLVECRDAVPDGAGFHLHVAEHSVDEFDSIAKSGTRVVDRLHKHGILGENTIVAHCVHVDAREVELLADTGTWVTHQPRSNMNNAVGMSEIESMLRAGVKIGLGNDGFSNAMWEEWKTTYLVHKLWHNDPRRVNGYDVLETAVYSNADLASTIFNTKVGSISSGSQADLIFVDYHPFTPITPGNLPWHILFGFHESMITTTIVAGKVLMNDRKIISLDVEEITQKALEIAPEVWNRYEKHFVA
jgi:cytosine/adenosine deaminase-related metal-dependent hydrolase